MCHNALSELAITGHKLTLRYTIAGRLLFMVFVGIMVSAMRYDFAYAMCGIVIINAAYNAVVMAIYFDRTAEVRRSRNCISTFS